MCGEHDRGDVFQNRCEGSSPHVRGARLRWRHGSCRFGIIPACAGSTSFLDATCTPYRDHPRMCGEHHTSSWILSWVVGSSPHVRGAQQQGLSALSEAGIIPACAGSTLRLFTPTPLRWDHPRMCGEHEAVDGGDHLVEGSSPHVRGALLQLVRKVHICGIIPACAGSTIQIIRRNIECRDHPRMCGEHTSKIA